MSTVDSILSMQNFDSLWNLPDIALPEHEDHVEAPSP